MVRHYSTAFRAAILLSAVAIDLSAASALAQVPAGSAASPFEMVGFIQKATLNDARDAFSGGTLTLNNHVVIVPRYTVLQMPATAVTWNELFKLAPAPYGPAQTGLALEDRPAPSTTFEVFVQGNRVGADYIAGLVFVSQQSTNTHQGFINAIDYGVGELRVGGTPGDPRSGARVRINDPIGRFGRAMSPDVRFTIDEDNPTVRSETAFPMCVPRYDPVVADDPACPQGNRPQAANAFRAIFEMPAPADGSTGAAMPDARRMAPFEVGDYITYSGNLIRDSEGSYISAWSVVANVGIFTAPGTQPVYIAIDVLLAGTGPTSNVALAQEAAKRTRVEGFTTDPTRAVQVFAVDIDPCTGAAANRFWAAQAIDPGPPNGAVKGRWRFRPAAPLFDLKGFPFLPSSREVLAVSDGARSATPLANGLVAGRYRAPVLEFLFTENAGIGSPPVPGNYDDMPFLAQGSGPWHGGGPYSTSLSQGVIGQLSPWPGAHPPGAVCATSDRLPSADAGLNQQADSGSTVTLDGSGSADASAAPDSLAYSWIQTSGPSVTLVNSSDVKPTFMAPVVPPGAATISLGFQLTVSNGSFASTATTTTVITAGAK